MNTDHKPTDRRMRQRYFSLSEQDDTALTALAERSNRAASDIVRAAVRRVLRDAERKAGGQ